MFRFKSVSLTLIIEINTFQYIICFGSSKCPWCIKTANADFNTSYVSVQEGVKWILRIEIQISIHHMFRFKSFLFVVLYSEMRFQYIICFGSSNMILPFFEVEDVISIHHMFRFKILQNLQQERVQNFNTSYVSVQVFCKFVPTLPHFYFNTSYVSVQASVREV